jgi:hypothetical protein
MKKARAQCLNYINISQLTLASKTKIKNLGRATSDLVVFSHYLAEYPAVYAKRQWVSVCADDTLF